MLGFLNQNIGDIGNMVPPSNVLTWTSWHCVPNVVPFKRKIDIMPEKLEDIKGINQKV
jgi:hypothetical protein